MSTGYSVLTRDYKKIEKMTEKCVMASAGFMADAVTLKKTLKARCVSYEFQNNKEMGCVSFAQMLSNTLYYRRFFPYYTFNIVAGLDKEGKGAVSLDGRLIDIASIKQAQNLVDKAEQIAAG